ncbi:MAG: helix-turn-helix transcriptional regulator [Bacteroidales bacterium]|nr:helix-turn-helix transcriptional regulator [Bacteroidales bacterium]
MPKAQSLKPIILYYKSTDSRIGLVCGRGISRKFPLHRHKSISLGMVIKGSRMLTINLNDYIIAEGDVFIINSEEPHAIGETQNPGHDYIVLSFAPALIRQNAGTGNLQFENIVGSDLLAGNLERLFHKAMTGTLQKTDMNIEWLISEMHCFRKKEPSVALVKDNRLEKVKTMLDQSLAEPHLLDTLADKAAISAFHMSRLFKTQTGMAPHQYLLDNRLRQAREFLESGQTVSDIAIAAGFYDTSHFIRHFSRYYGVTPQVYQQGIRSLPEE